MDACHSAASENNRTWIPLPEPSASPQNYARARSLTILRKKYGNAQTRWWVTQYRPTYFLGGQAPQRSANSGTTCKPENAFSLSRGGVESSLHKQRLREGLKRAPWSSGYRQQRMTI